MDTRTDMRVKWRPGTDTQPKQTIVRAPATIRPDWVMPEPPQPDMFPIAVDTGDGWWWGWESNSMDESPGITDWPFIEDYATGKDWERAGFCVV